MRIVHTSSDEIGQVYVPEVNLLLMLSTVALVLGFRSSGSLAAAYGVAVTATMGISTLLFAFLARERWGWPLYAVVPLIALFLALELCFFGASMVKVAHGAWFPLVVAAGIFALMATWKRGRVLLQRRMSQRAIPLQEFVRLLATQDIPRFIIQLRRGPVEEPPAELRVMRLVGDDGGGNPVGAATVAGAGFESADQP